MESDAFISFLRSFSLQYFDQIISRFLKILENVPPMNSVQTNLSQAIFFPCHIFGRKIGLL